LGFKDFYVICEWHKKRIKEVNFEAGAGYVAGGPVAWLKVADGDADMVNSIL
jgi:hypothetical protein